MLAIAALVFDIRGVGVTLIRSNSYKVHFGARAAESLKQVHRADYVSLDRFNRVEKRTADQGLRREVKNEIGPGLPDSTLDYTGIPDIAPEFVLKGARLDDFVEIRRFFGR